MSESTEAQIADASRNLTEIEAGLRDVHGEPVAELPSMRIYADGHGHELNEIAAEIDGVGRSEVSEWMHEQARGADYDWSHVGPVVVLTD